MTLSPSLQTALIVLTGVSSLLLGLATLVRRRGRLEAAFAAGQIAFAAETAAVLCLLATEAPGDRSFWLRVHQIAALTVPATWSVFVARLVGQPADTGRWPWRAIRLGILGGAAAAAVVQLAAPSPFAIADVEASFLAARLGVVAVAGIVMQVLATVAVLVGLETYLRTASRESLWRSKYLVLGLATIFVARLYFLSQTLLFHVLFAGYLTAGSAILLAGNVAIGGSLLRARLREAEVTISRRLLYRSVVLGVVGLYLLGLGALGWLLTWLQVSENIFWGSLIVFLSALSLAAVLMSEDVRWRVRRFIALHFYGGKYDYREQWVAFTKQLGSLLSLEDLSRQLLAAITTAVGAAKGALYVAAGDDARYRLTGTMELSPEPVLDERSPTVLALREQTRPLVIDVEAEARVGSALRDMPRGTVAVPLRWQGTLTGIMLIGPERTGGAYALEDFEFLSTIAEQAAGAIVTATLSETAARSREFEAFHRLTSFVVHDLKNSTYALSMLTQNALAHFEDPEFQRDALKTLSKTVDRMKGLMARLTAPPEADDLRFQPLDLAGLALDATRHVDGTRIVLVKDLTGTPTVEGDPDAMLRVMQNLVNNAIEALAPGTGTITVRTGEDDHWATFAVTDTGRGMSEEFMRTSLFAPFRSTKRGGWGIGLYHAKTIVEAHGGRIDVSSQKGEGTTFVVKLPVRGGAAR